jgi:predicted small lipoprotein YifL
MSKIGNAPAIAVLLVLAGVLAGGCGVRGSLEYPEATRSAQQATASAESGQGKPAGATAKPHKGFILDGLLR